MPSPQADNLRSNPWAGRATTDAPSRPEDPSRPPGRGGGGPGVGGEASRSLGALFPDGPEVPGDYDDGEEGLTSRPSFELLIREAAKRRTPPDGGRRDLPPQAVSPGVETFRLRFGVARGSLSPDAPGEGTRFRFGVGRGDHPRDRVSVGEASAAARGSPSEPPARGEDDENKGAPAQTQTGARDYSSPSLVLIESDEHVAVHPATEHRDRPVLDGGGESGLSSGAPGGRDSSPSSSDDDNDDDDDGVTLSPCSSTVSGLTNPTCLESVSRAPSEDGGDGDGGDSSSSDEGAAGLGPGPGGGDGGGAAADVPGSGRPSEASSSQPSEAAAPLIMSTLGRLGSGGARGGGGGGGGGGGTRSDGGGGGDGLGVLEEARAPSPGAGAEGPPSPGAGAGGPPSPGGVGTFRSMFDWTGATDRFGGADPFTASDGAPADGGVPGDIAVWDDGAAGAPAWDLAGPETAAAGAFPDGDGWTTGWDDTKTGTATGDDDDFFTSLFGNGGARRSPDGASSPSGFGFGGSGGRIRTDLLFSSTAAHPDGRADAPAAAADSRDSPSLFSGGLVVPRGASEGGIGRDAAKPVSGRTSVPEAGAGRASGSGADRSAAAAPAPLTAPAGGAPLPGPGGAGRGGGGAGRTARPGGAGGGPGGAGGDRSRRPNGSSGGVISAGGGSLRSGAEMGTHDPGGGEGRGSEAEYDLGRASGSGCEDRVGTKATSALSGRAERCRETRSGIQRRAHQGEDVLGGGGAAMNGTKRPAMSPQKSVSSSSGKIALFYRHRNSLFGRDRRPVAGAASEDQTSPAKSASPTGPDNSLNEKRSIRTTSRSLRRPPEGRSVPRASPASSRPDGRSSPSWPSPSSRSADLIARGDDVASAKHSSGADRDRNSASQRARDRHRPEDRPVGEASPPTLSPTIGARLRELREARRLRTALNNAKADRPSPPRTGHADAAADVRGAAGGGGGPREPASVRLARITGRGAGGGSGSGSGAPAGGKVRPEDPPHSDGAARERPVGEGGPVGSCRRGRGGTPAGSGIGLSNGEDPAEERRTSAAATEPPPGVAGAGGGGGLPSAPRLVAAAAVGVSSGGRGRRAGFGGSPLASSPVCPSPSSAGLSRSSRSTESINNFEYGGQNFTKVLEVD